MRMVGITVERKSRSGQLIGENEKLTPYEALKAITDWSAFQHFEEDRKGTLEVGKLADLHNSKKDTLSPAIEQDGKQGEEDCPNQAKAMILIDIDENEKENKTFVSWS